MAKKIPDDVLLTYVLANMPQVQIAKELHMTKAQINRRIKTPEFQELLSEYRRKILDGNIAYLTANVRKAVQTLVELLDDDNPFVRLKASTQIISMAQDVSIQNEIMSKIKAYEEDEI